MPRLFTVDEANALLPRLREILREMQSAKAVVDALRGELTEHAQVASGNGHAAEPEIEEKTRTAQRQVERLNALLRELRELGCELKGLDEGLVDFPSEREGRVVYLCWRLGEDRVQFWHEREAGFAGRQPL
jgi:hypothetical protein